MTICFIALGANLGEPKKSLKKACVELASHPHSQDFRCSNLYLTSPVSAISQPDYYNAVCCISWSGDVKALLNYTKKIECQLGKKTFNIKDAPRLIDLDILFFGDQIVFDEELILPHPRWHTRFFVLKPLSELAHDTPLPFGIDVDQMLNNFINPHNETLSCIGGLYALNPS